MYYFNEKQLKIRNFAFHSQIKRNNLINEFTNEMYSYHG